MDEVKSIERVLLILDAPKHMGSAFTASMSLDGGLLVNDVQLFRVSQNVDLVARDDRDKCKSGTLRFPALGTTAGVVVQCLGSDSYFYFIAGTEALEYAAGKARLFGGNTVVHRRVDRDCVHDSSPWARQDCAA